MNIPEELLPPGQILPHRIFLPTSAQYRLEVFRPMFYPGQFGECVVIGIDYFLLWTGGIFPIAVRIGFYGFGHTWVYPMYIIP